jgi:phage terminase small subunit
MQTVWTMKHSEDIDPVIAASIKSVTFTKTGPKIEMYDSNGSIKILSDLQGWNAPRKQEITGKDGSALAIKADVSAPEIASALAGLMAKL